MQTQRVEAQNLNSADVIVSIQGDTFGDCLAQWVPIAQLDMSDRAHGWVWVHPAGHKWYRLGIYEEVEVA